MDYRYGNAMARSSMNLMFASNGYLLELQQVIMRAAGETASDNGLVPRCEIGLRHLRCF